MTYLSNGGCVSPALQMNRTRPELFILLISRAKGGRASANCAIPVADLRTALMSATLATMAVTPRHVSAWHAEREVIDSQLSESLAVLTAYQSHIDDWQQRLANDRDELLSTKSEIDGQRQEIVDECAANTCESKSCKPRRPCSIKASRNSKPHAK